MADLENDEQEQEQRIARPQPSVLPPVAARGLSVPAQSASTGSTGELENEGLASHLAPRPIASPSPLEARTTADQGEMSRLQSTGSGISQIARAHPVAGGILRGLGTVGSIVGSVDPFARRILPNIPGTEEHHNQLLRQETGRIGEDLGEEQKEAATAESGAKTEQEQAVAEKDRAAAQALRQPQPKQGLTPEETTIHDLMTGENGQPRMNPETQKPFTYLEAYQATKQAGQDVKPAKEEKPGNPEQQLIEAENAVANAKTPEEKTAAANRLAQVKKSISEYTGLTTKPEKPGAGDARADRSYTYNNNKLDQLAKPIEDAVGRMGRLRDTLSQGTPQADALVAPELLTIMAGGAGSGLRMNEAEISRIVGGRSKWQSLEAAINQWRADPSKANSITPEQRTQIRALVDGVNAKLQQKQAALDTAREKLLDSDDPKEHRRIVTDAHSALSHVDEGGGENKTGGGVKVLSTAAIQQAAKEHGVSVDEVKRQAQAAGYTIQ